MDTKEIDKIAKELYDKVWNACKLKYDSKFTDYIDKNDDFLLIWKDHTTDKHYQYGFQHEDYYGGHTEYYTFQVTVEDFEKTAEDFQKEKELEEKRRLEAKEKAEKERLEAVKRSEISRLNELMKKYGIPQTEETNLLANLLNEDNKV